MSSAPSQPAPSVPVDLRGRPITPSRLRRALRVNIACGVMGASWFVVCAPQQILTVFFKNELGSTSDQLGTLVSITQLTALCNLLAIFIYSRTKTRKTVWIVATIIHRMLGFVLAGVAIYAAREGADRTFGAQVIIYATFISWVLAASTGTGWWSWMADLVPENIRGTFFGRRATIIRLILMVWFFAATYALDSVRIVNVLYVYAAIFAVGGFAGIVDIAIHAWIPEPRRADRPRLSWTDFLEPIRNRNFLTFSLAMGAWSFATSVAGPFVAPYMTAPLDKGGLGARMIWISVNTTIVWTLMILTGTAWGMFMDRFGRKPIVILGAVHPLVTWVAFFFMTPANFPYLLIPHAALVGVLAAAFWDGGAQLMLTLTPQKNRNAYLAWHMAAVGIIAAGGSKLGGWLSDKLAPFHHELWPGFSLGAFHVVVMASFGLTVLSVLLLLRIREGSEKPVGYVISRVFTPGIVRTFANLGTITAPRDPGHAARALRTFDGASSHLAVAEMVARLKDPDLEVREEAARALGRIGTPDPKAIEALAEQLRDPASTIRTDAAQALGRIGDPRAVPALMEAMKSGSEDLQDACARALEAIDNPGHSRDARALRTVEVDSGDMTVHEILQRLDHLDQEVREEAARALGRTELPEAFDALVRHLENPQSTIRPDAARALGRLGDVRAVPVLATGLDDPSAEVQEACARALGDIGGRAAVRHLLRLLDENHPERVIASGAEAVTKLGILEAAWEIFPRMHQTANPVLRRQLAIAVGNTLGRPGEFYGYLTAETSQQGSRLGKLVRGARRGLETFRRALPKKSPRRRELDDLAEQLYRVRGLMEAQQYFQAVAAMHDILRPLVLVAIDRQCPDDVALEYALARDVELGLGFWFVREVRQRTTETSDPELLHLDALLALYFLSVYRLPAPGKA